MCEPVMMVSFLSTLRCPRNGLHRVRWILPPVIGLDTAMTLLGQPDSYWSRPTSADEYNDFFAWFLTQGADFFLWTSLLYVVGAILVASLLPRPVALAATLAYVLGHYMGACSWITGAFGFGLWLPVCYAAAIGLALVLLGTTVLAPETGEPAVGTRRTQERGD